MTARERPRSVRGEGNPTAITIERLEALRPHWAAGKPTRELAQIAAQQFGISERQGRRLVGLLREQVRAEVSATTRADREAEVAEMFREVHRRAMEAGNFNAAVAAVNGLSRALGVPFMPQLEAQALQAVSAAFLEALGTSALPPSEKTMAQLHMAARGLMPLPDLARAPVDVLAQVAGADPDETGQPDDAGSTPAGHDLDPDP